MLIYQRYLSKSLIFFASLLFLIVLLLESNFGFKLFFKITNYFLWGLETEKISGNWRDFRLKNITCNFFGVSIKASNIHILINPISLFKMHKIFKKIETKNLVFSYNENELFFSKKQLFKKNISKKNIFFNHYIVINHIYSNKILLKLNNVNILLLNVCSGLKLSNNHLTILNTFINSVSLRFKNNNQTYLLNKKNIINKKQINNIFYYFLNHKKFLPPKNIHLTSIKCKQIIFFHKKFKNILFKGRINKQFIFKLKFYNFYKFNLRGKILLNSFNHPMYINLYIHRLVFPIKKKLILTSKKFNILFKGTVDNYYLSFKNIINVSGMPPTILNIFGSGNLTNFSLNKIDCMPLNHSVRNNKKIHLKKENYLQYISKLTGNINIFHNFNRRLNRIDLHNFNISANIMHKKLLMLGCLYYDNNNNIKIPKINFFSGKNQGFLSGSISKTINISSSINASHLDYFIPNLTGAITTTLNMYSFCFSPVISGIFVGEKLNWNNMIYLNNIRMFIHMNTQKNFTKNIFLSIKKLQFLKCYLDLLNLKIYWHNNNQILYCFLKNKNLTINFIIHGKFNYEKRVWEGVFKKINILTFNKKWILDTHPMIFFYNNKNTETDENNQIKYKKSIFSIFYKVKNFLFSSILNSSIKFKTNVFFKIQFKSKTKTHFSNIEIFLYSNNIILSKKIKNKIFIKKISSLRLLVNFKKNNLITQWVVYPLKNKNKKLFGFLNIYDCFNKQYIRGKYVLSNFPCFILNFFIPTSSRVQGLCTGHIKFLGTLYQPHILADMHLKDFYIKSNKILKYIILFFNPSWGFIKYIKINQVIFIKQGDVSFRLYSTSTHNIFNSKEWNILFNSSQVVFFIFPKVKLNISSRLNLHYCLLKYDLIGYLKSYLFDFKINEKNFIF